MWKTTRLTGRHRMIGGRVSKRRIVRCLSVFVTILQSFHRPVCRCLRLSLLSQLVCSRPCLPARLPACLSLSVSLSLSSVSVSASVCDAHYLVLRVVFPEVEVAVLRCSVFDRSRVCCGRLETNLPLCCGASPMTRAPCVFANYCVSLRLSACAAAGAFPPVRVNDAQCRVEGEVKCYARFCLSV